MPILVLKLHTEFFFCVGFFPEISVWTRYNSFLGPRVNQTLPSNTGFIHCHRRCCRKTSAETLRKKENFHFDLKWRRTVYNWLKVKLLYSINKFFSVFFFSSWDISFFVTSVSENLRLFQSVHFRYVRNEAPEIPWAKEHNLVLFSWKQRSGTVKYMVCKKQFVDLPVYIYSVWMASYLAS